jgi:hypothetical protein
MLFRHEKGQIFTERKERKKSENKRAFVFYLFHTPQLRSGTGKVEIYWRLSGLRLFFFFLFLFHSLALVIYATL